jgi:cellulose synthase/poly-beta-1,6-N-acetylglucosamine synthase-like glycosyltransferase
MTEIILFILFSVLLLNYLIFLSSINKGLSSRKNKNTGELPEEFVSVIISFRNESENILTSLKSISSQDYPLEKFEVIYVDDSSTDDSYKKIVETPKPSNIKILKVSNPPLKKAFKKKAISFGIENAKGEIIVTTDADCSHKPRWLRILLSGFDSNTGFISGSVNFNQSDSIFSKIQSLEFAGLILAGGALIENGNPTICNGANLAFRKSLFNKLKGYQDQIHLSSGEDELFMQKISAETNFKVKFCWDKEVVVSTNPASNWSSFLQQRQRWASKGLFYRNKSLVLKLVLIYLFYIGINIQIILSVLISYVFFISMVLSITLKFLIEHKILSKGIDFLFPRHLMKHFLLTEIFQIFYLTLAGFLGVIGNYKWKDRKLKR